MSIPYMPLFVADYEADTAHLTVEEDGIYMRLLRLCWRTPGCSVPDDDEWIKRRLRVSDDEFETVKRVIAEFFERDKARVFSPRLQREHERINETSQRRRNAGKKGGRPNTPPKTKEKLESPALTKQKQTESPASQLEPELEPDTKEEEPNGSSKKTRASRLSEDWSLPDDWFQWALDEGWRPEAATVEADKFRDYWISKAGKDAAKLNWKATWRNWMRNCGAPRVITGGNDRAPDDVQRVMDEVFGRKAQ